MAQQYEYKSIKREIDWPESYTSCAEAVNPSAAEDWEIFSVCVVVDTLYQKKVEIFYLRRILRSEIVAEPHA
jgi:hypothetical protein